MVMLGVVTPSGSIKTLEDLAAVIDAAIDIYRVNKDPKSKETGSIDSTLYEFMDKGEFIHVDEAHDYVSDGGPSLDWNDLD